MWSVACYSIAVDSLYKQAWWEQEVVVQEDIKLNVFKKKILKGIQTLVQSAQEETHVHMTKLSIYMHMYIYVVYTHQWGGVYVKKGELSCRTPYKHYRQV